jgi:hypothetical protein
MIADGKKCYDETRLERETKLEEVKYLSLCRYCYPQPIGNAKNKKNLILTNWYFPKNWTLLLKGILSLI